MVKRHNIDQTKGQHPT